MRRALKRTRETMMTELFNKAMRRRTVLGGAAAMAGTLAMPSILRARTAR